MVGSSEVVITLNFYVITTLLFASREGGLLAKVRVNF